MKLLALQPTYPLNTEDEDNEEGDNNGHDNRQTKMITDHHNDDDDNHTDVDVNSTSTTDSGGSGNSGNSASSSGGGEKGMSESLHSRILLFAQQVNIATLSLLSLLSSPPHYYSHHSWDPLMFLLPSYFPRSLLPIFFSFPNPLIPFFLVLLAFPGNGS